MTTYKKSYHIYQSNVLKGYLLGSLHMHMNPMEFEELRKQLLPLVASVDTFFLECNLPHHTALPYGVERAVLSCIEDEGKDAHLRHFESLVFQHAALRSSIWIGCKIIEMPWLKYSTLSRNPLLWLWASKIAAIFAQIYNTFYNIFTGNKHTKAVQDFAKEQHQIVLQLTNAYRKGDASELPKIDGDRVLLGPRNYHEANTIKKDLETCQENHLSLYVVGVAHIPGPNGLVELLKNMGYCLEPFDIASPHHDFRSEGASRATAQCRA